MKGKEPADPWRASVVVAQIPDAGLHRDLEAGEPTRKAMAEIAGLREILSVRAELDLRRESGGKVHVAGRLRARIGQTCVVTLDPIEKDIDEEIDLTFVPQEQIEPQIEPPDDRFDDDADDGESELSDLPEPIVNGVIDLGRLVTDALFLAIDPYPRKPGAVFEPQVVATDPEDHPFAALKALKTDPKLSPDNKKKDK